MERFEKLSVPLSQIAAVYQEYDDEIGGEEEILIRKYIPDVEYYDRFFADPIKGNFNSVAYLWDKNEFRNLWLRLAVKYPGKYIEAFLALNLPYWYPEMDSVREYIETDNYSDDYPVERKNLLPYVYDWYEKVSENEAEWMHFPLFKQLFSIGMPIWVLLFFEILFLMQKKRAAALAVPAVVLLWLTYMLGPVSSFRYIEPLLLTYPVWIVLALERRKED